MSSCWLTPAFDLKINDAWFNGHKHLPGVPTERGVADAERLTAVLTGKSGIRRAVPWNSAFGGRAITRPDDGELPVIDFPWGLKLTILSPTPKALGGLRKDWDKYLAALYRGASSTQTPQPVREVTRGATLETIAARKTKDDSAAPNGSSIAFLAEFDGHSLLLAADAHPDVLIPALRRFALERARVPASTPDSQVPPLHVDVFKLPHHGSRANVTLALFDLVRADHYVVSTSGAKFKHPDEEAMARVITRGRPAGRTSPTLWFNYVSATTKPWLAPQLAERYRYKVEQPKTVSEGATISMRA